MKADLSGALKWKKGGNNPKVTEILLQSPLVVTESLKTASPLFFLEKNGWLLGVMERKPSLYPKIRGCCAIHSGSPAVTFVRSQLCPPAWVDFPSKAFLIHSCFKSERVNVSCQKSNLTITIYIFAAQVHGLVLQLCSSQVRSPSGDYLHYVVIIIMMMRTCSLFSYVLL